MSGLFNRQSKKEKDKCFINYINKEVEKQISLIVK